MNGMFCYCTDLTSLDLSSFDTSNVTNMDDMFRNCKSLTVLDLSSFGTGNVTDMANMLMETKGEIIVSDDLFNLNEEETGFSGTFIRV